MDDLTISVGKNEPTITVSRLLKAPRALVWLTVSRPEHLVRWWGPHDHTNTVKQFDWRVGGTWRIQTRTSRGDIFTFHGEYREITPIERVVQTFGIEGMYDGKVSVDTLTLEDQGDHTLYSVSSRLDSFADRDGMMASGMEFGVREGFERLDQILIELARAPQTA